MPLGQPREITAVTRRDVFDFLREEAGPWWGRLSEIAFLEQLYDLDAVPSTDPRHPTAAEDIVRHRVANSTGTMTGSSTTRGSSSLTDPTRCCLTSSPGWRTRWSSRTPRQAMELITRLNSLLAPDGWELRTSGFISGRPVYAAARSPTAPDAWPA